MKLPLKATGKAQTGQGAQPGRIERMRALAQAMKSKRGGDIFKCPEGDTRLRILPPIEPDGDWYFSTAWHYGMGPDRKSVICHAVTYGNRCPVCEMREELLKNGNEEEKKAAKQMLPRDRIFANVWISESPDGVRGNKVFAFGPGVCQDLLGYFTDGDYTNEDGDSIDHVETGYFVKIKRQGKQLNTEYTVKLGPRPQALSTLVDDVDEILAKRKPLDTVFEVLSIDEIQELVDTTDFNDFSTNPRKGASSGGRSRSSKKDDE
jgi:hypothetical protein